MREVQDLVEVGVRDVSTMCHMSLPVKQLVSLIATPRL